MPYKSLESLKVDEDCILDWLRELGPKTALNYGNYFLRYMDWFREEGYWVSAQAMLRDYESLDSDRDRFGHVDVLKRHIRSKGTGSNDKRNAWQSVRSFYSFHRMPLPSLPRNEAARLFRPSEEDKRRALELAPIKLDEVKRLILNTPQPYKAAITVIFQGAMSLAEFTQFNLRGWKSMLDELDEPRPVKIDLYRGKTSRTKVEKYYTFLGEDAKNLIKEWLSMRPETPGLDALFVSYHKQKKTWVPLNNVNVSAMITRVAKKIGLVKQNGLRRYHIHAHEFRDLFKSLCTLNGVSGVASEFFLGHKLDKMGYDKSPEYDVEWFRRQYCKVEPQLNLISGSGNVEDMKKEVALEAIRRFAEAFGIDPMKVKIEKQKELGRQIDNEEEIQAIQNQIKKLRNNEDDPQMIVREEELEDHLAEGWQFVSVLPSKRILVRK